MGCERCHDLLPGVLDGEATPDDQAAFDAHLAGCVACRQTFATEIRLRDAVRGQGDRFTAPAPLRGRILAALDEAESAIAPAPAPVAAANGNSGFAKWRWFGSGAALAASLLLAVDLALAPGRSSPHDDIAGQVVSAHVRSLAGDHLTDVKSTDRHTVKPWFAGKIDLAPPVRDFAAEGFALIGGRVDALDGEPVAALVYGRRQHIINLFIGPARNHDNPAPPATERGYQVRGYHLLRWTEGDLAFWLISDLDAGELAAFARVVRSPPPGPT